MGFGQADSMPTGSHPIIWIVHTIWCIGAHLRHITPHRRCVFDLSSEPLRHHLLLTAGEGRIGCSAG